MRPQRNHAGTDPVILDDWEWRPVVRSGRCRRHAECERKAEGDSCRDGLASCLFGRMKTRRRLPVQAAAPNPERRSEHACHAERRTSRGSALCAPDLASVAQRKSGGLRTRAQRFDSSRGLSPTPRLATNTSTQGDTSDAHQDVRSGRRSQPSAVGAMYVRRDAEYGVLCADHHPGYSQPIGGAIAYEGYVSPSGVGYDIGCVAVAEPVLCSDGASRPIERAQDPLCADAVGAVRPVAPFLGVVARGRRVTVTVTLGNHRSVTLTPDHQVRTDLGWRRADELSEGDRVLCPVFIGLAARRRLPGSRPAPACRIRERRRASPDARESRLALHQQGPRCRGPHGGPAVGRGGAVAALSSATEWLHRAPHLCK